VHTLNGFVHLLAKQERAFNQKKTSFWLPFPQYCTVQTHYLA